MRWSKQFIPTLRDAPADAEAISHKLLVRAGFVRPLAAGIWNYLPFAQRTMEKIGRILREEMGAIGAQEFYLPAIHPAEVWKESGRWSQIGPDMFRLKDRKGSDLCLGMTHEEIFTFLARDELRSYKQLPQIWYQIQTKFRDEPRAKGFVRLRQFTMKDSYSFDADRAGLDKSFDLHREAYKKIFARSGLAFSIVEASSGAMGGSESAEFMVASPAGEDWVVRCDGCGYAANREKAQAKNVPVQDPPAASSAPEPFPTPGVRTIDDLAKFPGGATVERQIKTLVYLVENKPTLVLLRGDHQLHETKLGSALGTATFRPAKAEEIQQALGAQPGSLGAVGVKDLRIVADEALRGRSNMTTGANRNEVHLRGVDPARDVAVTQWADLREVNDGEPCAKCGQRLGLFRAIEVGHIFKLGTRYSETMKAMILGADGKQQPVVMGSYGIGLERIMSCAVEQHHDDDGISWPVSIAPYQVVVSPLGSEPGEIATVAQQIYRALVASGVEVLLDDRDLSAGVKLKDADLIGFPVRVTVGPKKLKEGKVELKVRRTRESRDVPVTDAVDEIQQSLRDLAKPK